LGTLLHIDSADLTEWYRFGVFLGVVLLVAVILELFARLRDHKKQTLDAKARRVAQAGIIQKIAHDLEKESEQRFARINTSLHVAEEISPGVKKFTEQAIHQTKLLSGSAQDFVWLLDPKNEALPLVLQRLKETAEKIFKDSSKDLVFSITGETKGHTLPAGVSRNMLLIFREAMNNSLEHAEATTVQLLVQVKEEDVLQIVFKDNGKGFDSEAVKKGQGMAEMRQRTDNIKGRLYVDAWPDKGTIISLYLRLPDKYIR
jgi:signal transduction histidine kinase